MSPYGLPKALSYKIHLGNKKCLLKWKNATDLISNFLLLIFNGKSTDFITHVLDGIWRNEESKYFGTIIAKSEKKKSLNALKDQKTILLLIFSVILMEASLTTEEQLTYSFSTGLWKFLCWVTPILSQICLSNVVLEKTLDIPSDSKEIKPVNSKGNQPWIFSSVQSLSRVWLFATPWPVARQASLSFTLSRSLLRLMSIESMRPSSHLMLSSPPALNLFQLQGLLQWVNSSHQVAEILELQL